MNQKRPHRFSPTFVMPAITQWIIRLITLLWWHLFSKLETYGLEHVSSLRGPVLFISNHTSEWDGPLIRSVLPMFSQFTPMFYVSLPKKYYQTKDRDFVRRALWGGTTFKLVGAWPVYKGTGDLNLALVHHLDLLARGGSITIFPEGRVSKDGQIGQFKVGAAFLAAMRDVEVVPVAITGINKRVERSGARTRTVTVSFGEPRRYPIDTGTTEQALQRFVDEVRATIVDLARPHAPYLTGD